MVEQTLGRKDVGEPGSGARHQCLPPEVRLEEEDDDERLGAMRDCVGKTVRKLDLLEEYIHVSS